MRQINQTNKTVNEKIPFCFQTNSTRQKSAKMDWDVPRNFHATNPFSSTIENATRWETLTENLQEPRITDIFSELMSDYISSTEQSKGMTAAAEQLGSSQASPDSTNPVDSTGNTTRNNAWPPLEVTDYSLEEWQNSNKEPLRETSAAEEAASQSSNHSTPVATPALPRLTRTRWVPTR